MSSSSSLLPELKKHEPKDAERLLADLVQSLLPQVSDDDPAVRWKKDRRYTEVLEAIGRRFKVNPWESSTKTRTQLLALLSSQLSQLAFSEPQARSARSRLGDRGTLPLRQYRIVFNDSFSGALERGIRRTHVENTITAPHLVQHLRPPDAKRTGG